MARSFDLRPIASADRDGLLEVFDSNLDEFLHDDERPGFEEWLGAPQGVYLTLTEVGRAIGCGGYVLDDDRSLRLTWGLLHRDHHGRGIGRWMLLERLCRGHRELDPPRSTLGTTPRVEPFFAGVGFRRLSFTADGWGPGLDRVDMELTFDDATVSDLERRRAASIERLRGA
ncbi:MAG: GNAT family N-acetyltransferase [Planctomycetota bacterium]